jgi:hypothetical protein
MSISEKRTQIYLPLALFGILKKEAKAERKSIAEIIRAAIIAYLDDRSARKASWGEDPLARGLGSIVADADLSVNHNAYLYGKKAKKK